MRVTADRHHESPWRIHDLLPDFDLEDVWVLPEVTGSAGEFRTAVSLMTDADPARSPHRPTRSLWRMRDLVGRRLHLGGISAPSGQENNLVIPGTTERSIQERLPDDLRGSAADIRFLHLPFVPLYLRSDEFAAEISNATVHGVMHLGWVPLDDGTFQGQMAVYVKPRGVLGSAYMWLIKPFRYLIVYPALERQLSRTWADRNPVNRI